MHDDDEATLLMAQLCTLNDEPEPAPPGGLRLDESRAQVNLGTGGDGGHVAGWFLDTGATSHMTGRAEVFSKLDRAVQGTVRFGDGSLVQIHGRGTITFAGKSGEKVALAGVLFIPRLKNNIISVGQLDRTGCKVEIEDGVMRIWDRRRRLLCKVHRGRNQLYVLNLDVAPLPLCLAARHDDGAWRWHARYGHIGFDALRQLSRRAMVHGLPLVEEEEAICDTCVVTKHRRAPFPTQARYRAEQPLDLVHGDLCGPVKPATPGDKRYFLLLVDDASRFMWLVLLAAKSDAAEAIKRIQAGAESECGRTLHVLRTDNGGEFTAAEFADYCADRGIQRHFSAPYAPQQNGVVERRNQTILAMARALLKERSMPTVFWGEAVVTAVYILNRAPTKALDGKTPYEAWFGRTPAVAHLRTFGCVGYVKDTRPHLKKLDDRSAPMVFIGYAIGSKAYRLYDPKTERVHVSRDVIFDEDAAWNWKEAEQTAPVDLGDFAVEQLVRRRERTVDRRLTPDAGGVDIDPIPLPATSSPSPQTVEFVSPPANDSERLDAESGSASIRYRDINAVLGEAAVPGHAARSLHGELHLVTNDGEPTTFAEAAMKSEWLAAMIDELQSVEDNGTWELTELPAGHRAIGLKWVYKLKKDEAGAVIKHKARLVAKGYVQQAGIDFDEVFAPVARMDLVRLLLAFGCT